MALLLNTNDKCQMGITTTQYLPTPLMKDERLTPTAREVKWGVKVLDGSEKWLLNNISQANPSYARFNLQGFLSDCLVVENNNKYAECTHFGTLRQGGTGGYTAQNAFEIRPKESGGVIYVVTNAATDAVSFKSWLKSEYDAGHPVTVWYQLANPTTEPVTTTPIGTLRNEEKTVKGTTTIITTDTEVLPTQIEASYKSNKR